MMGRKEFDSFESFDAVCHDNFKDAPKSRLSTISIYSDKLIASTQERAVIYVLLYGKFPTNEELERMREASKRCFESLEGAILIGGEE